VRRFNGTIDGFIYQFLKKHKSFKIQSFKEIIYDGTPIVMFDQVQIVLAWSDKGGC
jgi:hypothetical protein